MNKFIINHLILILILVLALFLRLWNLGSYPALNADEAAIGYNAYSLIRTGMDEHGNSWPIHFESFNDYKPGLYFYLVLPFIKFFGLNAWSVRLPNALLGVATVYLLYLLNTELKNNNSLKIGNINPLWLPKIDIAEISALFLAISPWHIHFSRGGWEVNTATFFMMFGVYMFIKAISRKNILRYLMFSALFFVLSLYTYHAARIVSPLLVVGLIGIYWREVVSNIKYVFLALVFGLICMIPLIHDLTRSDVLSRAAGVGLFADSGPVNRINEQRGEHGNFNGYSTKLLHNKAVNYTLAFMENWGVHYHGLFLFLSGDDIERDKVPETGQMYMLDILWIVVGLMWMVKNLKKGVKVVIYWLLVAPVAAALTFQSPHALRSENMVIPLTIITSIGFILVWQWMALQKWRIFKIGNIILLILVIWQLIRYQHMYWVHMSKEYPYSSQYGVSELVSYISQNQDKYKNVIVTTRFDQPYILFLYYMKYPPAEFQNDHILTGKDEFGFSTVPAFGKYIFKPIDWDNDKPEYDNSMIIGTPNEIPKEANIVKRIYGTNGFEYFDVVAN
jgi:4-amino-4-deoxy-L-arabinose transferase-like glycosyltransferase